MPYTVGFTLLHGPPRVVDFRSLDSGSLQLAARIDVVADPSLGESETVLEMPACEPIAVAAALGSPERPMDEHALSAKIRSLAGSDLDELVDDSMPARGVLERVIVAR